MSILPTTTVPKLTVPTLNGDTWNIQQQQPENYTLVVVYRGLHCPICEKYTQELRDNLSEFQQRGVEVIAISADNKERATQAQQDWDLKDLTIGYDLDINQARQWRLFISESIGESNGIEEPSQFVEPGLFLIKPDQTLFFASIQTMPFARPSFKDVLGAIDYVQENGYPARGDVAANNSQRAAA